MKELTEVEVAEVSGGFIPQILVAIAIYDAVTDFAKGYAEGVEASKR
ncbi:MAG: class IIb bacteriocin, lactobin A/cerein 7B family [Pseudoxanthomonas sp.]